MAGTTQRDGSIKNPILISLMSHLEWIAYHSAHKCIAITWYY